MDAESTSRQGYERPSVVDYGTLAEMTADPGMMLLGLGQIGLSVPLMPDIPRGPGGPGGPGGEVLDVVQLPETGPIGEALPGEAGLGESAPAGVEAEGGGGVLPAGGAGGSLPFTGFSAAGVAAAGATLAGAGAALRRAEQRKQDLD